MRNVLYTAKKNISNASNDDQYVTMRLHPLRAGVNIWDDEK